MHARLGLYIANEACEGQEKYRYVQLSPLFPRLKAKFKNYLVLKDGDEQHDAEPSQHAQVLQDEVSDLAALVVLAVPV